MVPTRTIAMVQAELTRLTSLRDARQAARDDIVQQIQALKVAALDLDAAIAELAAVLAVLQRQT